MMNLVIIVVVISSLCSVLLAWDGTIQFDSGIISWQVQSDTITFHMEAQTNGWIGLGWSPEDGKMLNADMVILTGTDDDLTIGDYFSTGLSTPTQDDDSSITSLQTSRASGVTMMEFSRPLATTDTETDKPILPGTTLLIWAYGDSEDLEYHMGNRGTAMVELVEDVQAREAEMEEFEDTFAPVPPRISRNKSWDGSEEFPGGTMRWRVENSYITFHVEAATSGWLGIGWSPEDGKMLNADMVILSGRDLSIADYYSTGFSEPRVDRQQDVIPMISEYEGGVTIMEFRKPLSTGDVSADKDIVAGEMEVIWAYGDSRDEINYHNDNRGVLTVTLLSASIPEPSTTPTDNITWDGTQDFQGGTFSWKVDINNILFFVEADTSGWLGIGWSPDDGKMLNADMVILTGSDSDLALADYFSEGMFKPSRDDDQDVTQMEVGKDSGMMYMQFSRPLQTEDSQDKDILLGVPMVVIWAYGKSTSDIDYHGGSRGSVSLVLVTDENIRNPDDALYVPTNGSYLRDGQLYERIHGEYYPSNSDGYAKIGTVYYKQGKAYIIVDGEYLEGTAEGFYVKDNFYWKNNIAYAYDNDLYYQLNSDGFYSKDGYLWKNGIAYTHMGGTYYPINKDGYSYHDNYYWKGAHSYGMKGGNYYMCNSDGFYFYEGYWWKDDKRFIMKEGRYYRT